MPQRKNRIARYEELPRPTKRIRARKADPAKRRYAKHRCKPFTEWLKTQACVVTGKRTGIVQWSDCVAWMCGVRQIDPAHIKTRATGGDDLYNALSLARYLHEEQHSIGWPAFERKYGINAREIAKQQTAEWLATDEGKKWSADHDR